MTDLQYTQGSLSLRIDNPLPPSVVVIPRIPGRRRERRRLQDARTHGIPDLKRCRDCDVVKSSDEFNRVTAARDGLAHYCKDCSRQRSRKWWKKIGKDEKQERHAAQHAKNLQIKYGMTIDGYNDRVAAQGGKCSICQLTPEPPLRLVVDHDHETGQVRDLLCKSCNIALGYLRDNPDVSVAAADYLRRHGK